ncbi:MAG: COG4280 domain-containing protein [Candidatus Dormibacteria bacterium]
MSILVLLATALAAAVEWVEALTIVLAVGLFKGWKAAFVGMALGLLALVALVAVFGVTITSHVSIEAARTLVGVFLLLFGLKWLHKAILRSSGLKSLHDEAKTFEETKEMLVASGTSRAGVDRVGVTTSFGGVFLEGLEVVFIVVALGGLQNIPAAAIGAVVALVIVAVAGIVFRHPLTRVPENTMKYVVGIMLTAFGTFFTGEGIGVHWWGADLSLLPLIAVYGLASVGFVQLLKQPIRVTVAPTGIARAARTAVTEVWGLFVDDGALAIVAILAIFGVALFAAHYGDGHSIGGALLIVGVLLAVWAGLHDATKSSRKARPTSASPPLDTVAAAPSSALVNDAALVAPAADR